MQIKSIVLYNDRGEQRVLDFRLNAVNIITGASQTGKSSLIHIIDYCLGRSTFQVAEGIITDVVMWYGVLLQFTGFQTFIAKPKPQSHHASQSEAFLRTATAISVPEMSELVLNSNDQAIMAELSLRTGIAPNLHIPPEGHTREPLEANLSHSKLLLFQPQSVIANREVLFYRQSEPYMSQAIKDTLLYFLGVVQEDRLRLVRELQDKRRQARSLRRELQEIEGSIQQRVDRGMSLIVEAQEVGLIERTVAPASREAIFEVLKPIREWTPSVVPPVVNDSFIAQQTELEQMRRDFQAQHHAIESAKLHVKYASAYLGEATEQMVRLESINLFSDETSSDICPLCGSPHDEPVAPVDAITRSLQNLRSDVSFVTRERPEIDDYINGLESELERVRLRIQQKELDIQSLIDEHEAVSAYRDTNTRIARIVGRISYFLDVTPATLDDEGVELRNRLSQVEREIEALDAQLDSTNLEDRKASILNIVGADMTRMSTQLNLEHEGLYRFDLNKLTVVVDMPDRSIVMNQNMGSASNHLGCHLLALLALHRFFIQQLRPVPSFLVLDQPTQVYFPLERYESMEGEESELNDEDRIAVQRMFNLLFEFCQETGLQIIVLEHANLSEPDFQTAIIDGVWRQGNALIPSHWTS